MDNVTNSAIEIEMFSNAILQFVNWERYTYIHDISLCSLWFSSGIVSGKMPVQLHITFTKK